MERINLLGMTFGRLTVIGDTRPKCLCRCTCGNEKLIARNKLPNGRQKSCGCEHGNAIRALKREDFTGLAANRLVCIDNMASGTMRKFRCECGGEIMALPRDVRSGNTKSCGCWKNETSSRTGALTCGRNSKGASQSRWRVTIGDQPVQLRSGFELIYLEHLQASGIAFMYEPKLFCLTPSLRYTPDFYLPETDEWVEVKGHLSDRSAEKIKLFRELGHKLTVLSQPQIMLLLPKGTTLAKFYSAHQRVKGEVAFVPPRARKV
jgi:hypothetical protein